MYHDTLCTVNALKSTIETDKNVSEWFLYVLSQPQAKSDLKRIKNKDLAQVLNQLSKFRFLKNFLNICLLVILVLGFFIKSVYLLSVILILFSLNVWMGSKLRQFIAKISLCLVTEDFDDAKLRCHTLYQIGDNYAKKYNINSLVHTITSIDILFRRFCLYIFFPIGLAFPFVNKYYFFLILLTVYIIFQLIKTVPIYLRPA